MSTQDEISLLESTQAAQAPILVQASDGKEISSWLWTIAILFIAGFAVAGFGISIHNLVKLKQAPGMVEREIKNAMVLLSNAILTNVTVTTSAESEAIATFLDGIQTAIASLDTRVSALEGSRKR